MKKINFITSLSLKAIVFILLFLTPIAISFKPYYTPEKPGYPAVFDDPQYLLKAFFIATGLIGGILAVVSTILYLITTRPLNKPQLVIQLSMAVCAVALGWHVFPYCVNGLFQASLGNADFGDFDPKRLMPTIWIGEIWSDIALFLFPILIVTNFILILMTINMALRKNLTSRETLLISIFLIITVLTFINFPQFGEWIMD